MPKYLHKMIQRKNERVSEEFGFVADYNSINMCYIVQWIYTEQVQIGSRFMSEGERYINQYALIEYGDPVYE